MTIVYKKPAKKAPMLIGQFIFAGVIQV